jgi:hypothetical protein
VTSSRSDRIDDAVARWHETNWSPALAIELHEYLGWTWDEYRAYTERGALPPEREGAL